MLAASKAASTVIDAGNAVPVSRLVLCLKKHLYIDQITQLVLC